MGVSVWIHLFNLVRSISARGSVCSTRKGLEYILNTALKNAVLMSGVPYGAAVSAASGSFQGRGATFFLTCSVALWHKLKGGTSGFSHLVWEGEPLALQFFGIATWKQTANILTDISSIELKRLLCSSSINLPAIFLQWPIDSLFYYLPCHAYTLFAFHDS